MINTFYLHNISSIVLVCVRACAQYARETDQLNKINRNEGRQKLFSLDPETQV